MILPSSNSPTQRPEHSVVLEFQDCNRIGPIGGATVGKTFETSWNHLALQGHFQVVSCANRKQVHISHMIRSVTIELFLVTVLVRSF